MELDSCFSHLPASEVQWLESCSQEVSLEVGQHLAWEGEQCTGLGLVLTGQARVYKLGESGREITLYRVEPGESCILTASCLLSQQPFPAFAQVEQALRARWLAAESFRQRMHQSEAWRTFVFELLSRRLASVISVVEEVAFRRVDHRLADFLLQHPAGCALTHQQIAQELGSSREVISRLLKDFERHGWVSLGRGHLSLLDGPALKAWMVT
ncbi:MAG: Crp/Fnr family transcriptional regulator [Vulcanimicrobiota bacterium]